MTPPRPPQTSTAPARPSSRPTSSAWSISLGDASPAPTTAMYEVPLTAVEPSSPGPSEDRREQRDGAGLVEWLVPVAALRGLDA